MEPCASGEFIMKRMLSYCAGAIALLTVPAGANAATSSEHHEEFAGVSFSVEYLAEVAHVAAELDAESVERCVEIVAQSRAAGGRLFAVVGEAPAMTARLVTCTAPGAWRSVDLFETVIRPLANAERPPRFHF